MQDARSGPDHIDPSSYHSASAMIIARGGYAVAIAWMHQGTRVCLPPVQVLMTDYCALLWQPFSALRRTILITLVQTLHRQSDERPGSSALSNQQRPHQSMLTFKQLNNSCQAPFQQLMPATVSYGRALPGKI
ncbi:MAG: hypothetical protein Q9M31_04780 [Mariprofundus sp.]|nr:hypothetical protein [Mariprofundus sp.]